MQFSFSRLKNGSQPALVSALIFFRASKGGLTPSRGFEKRFRCGSTVLAFEGLQSEDGRTVRGLELVDSRGRSDRAARGKICRRGRSNRRQNVFEIVQEGSNRAGGAIGSSAGTV